MNGRLTGIHTAIVMDAWPLYLKCDLCGSVGVDIIIQTSGGRRHGQVLGCEMAAWIPICSTLPFDPSPFHPAPSPTSPTQPVYLFSSSPFSFHSTPSFSSCLPSIRACPVPFGSLVPSVGIGTDRPLLSLRFKRYSHGCL